MIETEYLKSMNLNYQRVKLSGKPEDKRYQYCILSRGGIRGLLDCSLRYINGDAYLYYDITSKQSISKMFYNKKTIDRAWVKDFVWNLNRIYQEISRFLLDDNCVIWYPEQVYQDLEDNRWSFIYYPYYKGETGFRQFLEFIIEKLDYDDEGLVNCVYSIYEQYETVGDAYLKEKIFKDVLALDNDTPVIKRDEKRVSRGNEESVIDLDQAELYERDVDEKDDLPEFTAVEKTEKTKFKRHKTNEKKGLLSFLDGAKRRDRAERDRIREDNIYAMEFGNELSMVSEEPVSYDEEISGEEEYGRTIYMENVAEAKDTKRRLFDEDGAVLAVLGDNPIVIGKRKEDADVVIDNRMVSRLHARISRENGDYMIEDLNSTNGTFKNGLRLAPYEKRKLMEGDEIRLGSTNILYK